MPSHWRPAALRAQAIAARTYALATRNPGSSFDLYADTRDQMYGGIRAEKPSTNGAVAATAGEIVTWLGQPARTYYSSTSGGRTESGRDAWGYSLPYLASVVDPYDAISPHHDWGPRRLSGRTLARRFGVPSVADVIERWNASGRVVAVAFRWHGAARVVGGGAVKTALKLPSNVVHDPRRVRARTSRAVVGRPLHRRACIRSARRRPAARQPSRPLGRAARSAAGLLSGLPRPVRHALASGTRRRRRLRPPTRPLTAY